jgi:hypothetical protein
MGAMLSTPGKGGVMGAILTSSLPVFLPAVNSKKWARLSFILDLFQHILAVSCSFNG